MKQIEFFGEGSIHKLKDILLRFTSKKIFLVTGKDSFEKSGGKSFFKEISKNFEIRIFNDFSGNPEFEDVQKGIKIFKEDNYDTVVAFGGGGVIDIAKSINILSAQKSSPNPIINGKVSITTKGKSLIAIPTTSGSGSEATHFAVIYVDKCKYSIAHEFMLPNAVFIDPVFTYSLNKEITATSGIDAFSQAVESYWSVNSNNKSKDYSAEAILLIMNNLHSAVTNPGEENRRNMSRAANLAGKAINLTKTTAPHALSYSMTSFFGIPHGQAVSITLGEFLEYNNEIIEEEVWGNKNIQEIKATIQELVILLGCKDVHEAKIKIKNLMESVGLKTKLSELKIESEDDLKIIMDKVNLERLHNNPRKISRSGLETILRNVL